MCQESFRNPGDGNPRICQDSGNHLFFDPYFIFFDPEPWRNCCISCSIVSEYFFWSLFLFFLIPNLIFFLIPHPPPEVINTHVPHIQTDIYKKFEEVSFCGMLPPTISDIFSTGYKLMQEIVTRSVVYVVLQLDIESLLGTLPCSWWPGGFMRWVALFASLVICEASAKWRFTRIYVTTWHGWFRAVACCASWMLAILEVAIGC